MDCLEEGVLFDLLKSRRPVTQPLRGVPLQQGLDEGVRLAREVLGQLNLVSGYLLLQGVLVLAPERWKAHQHLVKQDPDAPPVHSLPVPVAQDHFGGHVLYCAAHAVRSRLVRHVTLGQTKVGHFQVPVRAKENVLRLHIPVNKPQAVEVTHREDHLRREEPRNVLREEPLVVQLEEEMPPVDELHHHVQLAARLKRVVERHDERVVHARQYLPLHPHVIDVVLLQDLALLQHLHRVNLIRALQPHLEHLAERPLAHHPQQLKVLRPELRRRTTRTRRRSSP
mmetsp:Transcript_10406/g.29483  ORF Transcript_10406/g.29483 Transcript_10406/m.29483 type:complete len:282 (-) Transcript_10406:508-1353(-)